MEGSGGLLVVTVRCWFFLVVDGGECQSMVVVYGDILLWLWLWLLSVDDGCRDDGFYILG